MMPQDKEEKEKEKTCIYQVAYAASGSSKEMVGFVKAARGIDFYRLEALCKQKIPGFLKLLRREETWIWQVGA